MSARSAGEPLRLVAVVPVHDGGKDIAACLAGLLDAGQPAADIVVVDDASSDGAARAAAASSGIRLERLADGPRGPARARNVGASLVADADAFLFVDADVVLHQDAVERFHALLESEPGTSAAFGSYDDDPPAPGWISQYKNLSHHRMHQCGAREACTFWSGCGVVRRDAFFAAGGFDERFARASIEDVDLGLRLTDAGHRVRLCPDILCAHRKVWTLGGWLRTDIFLRALPWSRLLHRRGKGLPDNLNLGYGERASAALALLATLALVALPLAPMPAALALTVTLAGFVTLQRGLLGFLARRRGMAFALAATLMHLCYFVYSSVVYVLVRVSESSGIRVAPPSPR